MLIELQQLIALLGKGLLLFGANEKVLAQEYKLLQVSNQGRAGARARHTHLLT